MKVIRTIQGAKYASLGPKAETSDMVALIKQNPWMWLQRVEVVDIEADDDLSAEDKRFIKAGEKGCFPISAFQAAILKREMKRESSNDKFLKSVGLPDMKEFEKIIKEPEKKKNDEDSDKNAGGSELGAGATSAAGGGNSPDGNGAATDSEMSKGNLDADPAAEGLTFESGDDKASGDGSDAKPESAKPKNGRGNSGGKPGDEAAS
jgi:hypothetical protein